MANNDKTMDIFPLWHTFRVLLPINFPTGLPRKTRARSKAEEGLAKPAKTGSGKKVDKTFQKKAEKEQQRNVAREQEALFQKSLQELRNMQGR